MASIDKNTNNNFMAMNMMIMNKKKKTTQGRKKVEIKKIDNVSNRQVTFSKRRAGLFKKASELCILTGAEVAIIVQSSGKRVYAFGHPSVGGVIDRYTKGSSSSPLMSMSSKNTASTSITISAAEMREHNLEYNRLCQELEAEKKKMELQEKATFVNNGNTFWWDEPIDHLELEELEQYAAALEELRKNVLTKADELALMLKNSHVLGMNINVDLNQTMTTTVSCCEDDDLMILNNQTNQNCPSSSNIVPYASDYHSGNQQV